MPQIDFDGANSLVKTDKIQGQGGTTVTVPTSHTLAITDADRLTIAGTAVKAGALGMYASIAIIADQKAYDADGGTFTNGAWRTRDLNTEISDVDGIVSISSNQFILQAGTYSIQWSAPAHSLGRHLTRLYNVTDTSVTQYGSAAYTGGADVETHAVGEAVTTIGAQKTFSIQHRSQNTTADNGLGIEFTTDSAAVSIYTIVKILKHA